MKKYFESIIVCLKKDANEQKNDEKIKRIENIAQSEKQNYLMLS